MAANAVSSKRPLRVALISEAVRPTGRRVDSGTGLVAELSRELQRLGHHTTLLTPGPASSPPPRVHTRDRLAELRHTGAAWAQIRRLDQVDVVHVSFPEAIPFTSFVPVPTVATVQDDRRAALSTHYLAYPAVSLIAVSRRQAELSAEIPFRGVVHPGFPVEQHPLGSGGRRCVFVGSLRPEQGAHLAIEASRRARIPLVLAGDAPRAHPRYFSERIAPELGAGVTWIGDVDRCRRLDLLSSARALLAPAHWEEPFGHVMIEAMLVGTPVIAYACGAAPEVIEDGLTGFVVHDVDEMCRRIRDVAAIDRKTCRQRARSRWSSERMARQYAALYEEVIDHHWRQHAPKPQAPASVAATVLVDILVDEHAPVPVVSGPRVVTNGTRHRA
jgi:glycosyltransferase involved in cell wall biosynthesis